MSKNLTTRAEDYSKWYNELVVKADLAENSGVRGCMVIKPYGYAIWEKMQAELDRMFKETGHSNAYFPLFVPKSMFEAEEKNAEGFAKECAIVTHYRLKNDEERPGKLMVDPNAKLEEELIVRPTSEAIIWSTYKGWVQSYRDLPLLINQWANVVRWEMRTRLFLRTAEFLWQEGHTAHADKEDALRRTLGVLDEYARLCEEFLAIPVHKGEKTPSERFAGAAATYSIEAMMKDGKAVQAGTSHYMGTNFAEAFDITYLNKENKHVLAHTTSWGASTRLIGSLIMTHGDEKGLVFPPTVAPTQVVLLPVGPWKKNPAIMEKLDELFAELKAKGIRVRLDDSDNSPGFKFNQWELKGACLRVECGPRDLENNHVMVKVRDLAEKETVPFDELVSYIEAQLAAMTPRLLAAAKARNAENEHFNIETLDDLKAHIEACKADNKPTGFVLIGWDGTEETEAKIKEETGFTTRNIPFEVPMEKTVDIVSGKPAKHTVWIARAY